MSDLAAGYTKHLPSPILDVPKRPTHVGQEIDF